MSCLLLNTTGLQKSHLWYLCWCGLTCRTLSPVPVDSCLFWGQTFGELITEPQLMLTEPERSSSLCFACLYLGFSSNGAPAPLRCGQQCGHQAESSLEFSQVEKVTLAWNKSCPSPGFLCLKTCCTVLLVYAPRSFLHCSKPLVQLCRCPRFWVNHLHAWILVWSRTLWPSLGNSGRWSRQWAQPGEIRYVKMRKKLWGRTRNGEVWSVLFAGLWNTDKPIKMRP